MKCPVCDMPIADHQKHFIDKKLTEERAVCRDQDHYYYYLYFAGSTEEQIGRVSFIGYMKDTQKYRETRNRQREAVLKLEREHYQSKRKVRNPS